MIRHQAIIFGLIIFYVKNTDNNVFPWDSTRFLKIKYKH